MKVHATLNNIRIAPRKARLVAHTIVGMSALQALVELSKQTKKASNPLHTLLKSAIANAENNFGLDQANLFVASVFVGDGLRLKRWLPRAFGRATPLIRRSSNVKIVLEEIVEGKNRRSVKKPVATEETKEVSSKEEKKVEAPKAVKPTSEKVKEVKPKTAGNFVKKVVQRKAI